MGDEAKLGFDNVPVPYYSHVYLWQFLNIHPLEVNNKKNNNINTNKNKLLLYINIRHLRYFFTNEDRLKYLTRD